MIRIMGGARVNAGNVDRKETSAAAETVPGHLS